jgi:hypothetical protein
MIFLQLTVQSSNTDFNTSKWLECIRAQDPNAILMEVDNFSEIYLLNKTLEWALQSTDPLTVHIHSFDSVATTGGLFRFLQELLEKKKPIIITLLGQHTGIEKYVRAFGEYRVVGSEEEAVALANSK